MQHTGMFLKICIVCIHQHNMTSQIYIKVQQTNNNSTLYYSSLLGLNVNYLPVTFQVIIVVVLAYSTVQYSAVQYSTVQCSTVQYSTVQYSTLPYSSLSI